MHTKFSGKSRRHLLLAGVAVLALIAAAGCPPKNGKTDGPLTDYSKEELIGLLNANNKPISSIVCRARTTVTNEQYPKGQDVDADVIYARPDKLFLTFSALGGAPVFQMSTDGKVVDIYNQEEEKGRTATVERLKRFSDQLGGLRPELITIALGLDVLDPAQVEMRKTDDDYILTVKSRPGELRLLYVDRRSVQLKKQEVYFAESPSRAIDATVQYLRYSVAKIANSEEEVTVPTHIIVEAPAQNLKFELKLSDKSIKEIHINDAWRVQRLAGDWRVEYSPGTQVVELNDEGQWVPIP